jgi:hypothetical protein
VSIAVLLGRVRGRDRGALADFHGAPGDGGAAPGDGEGLLAGGDVEQEEAAHHLPSLGEGAVEELGLATRGADAHRVVVGAQGFGGPQDAIGLQAGGEGHHVVVLAMGFVFGTGGAGTAGFLDEQQVSHGGVLSGSAGAALGGSGDDFFRAHVAEVGGEGPGVAEGSSMRP